MWACEYEEPSLDILLRISPPELRKKFWNSTSYRSWWLVSDTCTSILSIVMDWFYLRAADAAHPQYAPTARIGSTLSTAYIAISTIQLCVILSNKQRYMCCRSAFMYLNRSLRLLQFLALSPLWASALLSFHHPPPSHQCTNSPPTALRNTLWWSSSIQPLLSTLHSPLPLLPQALFHLAYLAASLHSRLLPGIALINRTDCIPPIQTLCQTLNLTAFTALSAIRTSPPPDPPNPCTHHPVPAILLFAQIYIGCLIPIFISYRIEHHTKISFLRSISSPPTPPPPTRPPSSETPPPAALPKLMNNPHQSCVSATPPSKAPPTPPSKPAAPQMRPLPASHPQGSPEAAPLPSSNAAAEPPCNAAAGPPFNAAADAPSAALATPHSKTTAEAPKPIAEALPKAPAALAPAAPAAPSPEAPAAVASAAGAPAELLHTQLLHTYPFPHLLDILQLLLMAVLTWMAVVALLPRVDHWLQPPHHL